MGLPSGNHRNDSSMGLDWLNHHKALPVKNDESLLKRIQYEYPFYEDLVEPNGCLTLDKASHACWYYTILAMRSRQQFGDGPESQIIEYKVGETPPEWKGIRDEEIARGVALLYGLESPDEFLRFKDRAWAQAQVFQAPVNIAIYDVRPGTSFRLNS